MDVQPELTHRPRSLIKRILCVRGHRTERRMVLCVTGEPEGQAHTHFIRRCTRCGAEWEQQS